eukprot:CAMPEP_0201092274 /NCGR_PEP_ID=MMETSP0812-20130820/870_1 /ASSEMBLY_ACC=CAM_ASM_000668 /TAXON_ID=98059 /ORGANISM="Dinobryon sp., Strain UTEXLB2267" /LENGTH=105 /DNA_ID=CAMNT_0047343791 /DNA_START=23 /DNA_END=340 /DNA_ORIENTATION=+
MDPKFSAKDLLQGAKRLQHSDSPSENKGSSKMSLDDQEALERLEALYEKHGGDLDDIFAELRADPSKAKKPHHRPKSAREFASKYMEGFYSLVEDNQPDAKDSRK